MTGYLHLTTAIQWAGLLIGRVTGQRDQVLERVLRAEVRRVPDGRVREVSGGGLGENGGAWEVQRRGGMWTPGDTAVHCNDRSVVLCEAEAWRALLRRRAIHLCLLNCRGDSSFHLLWPVA